jgi:hypothetical protein
LLVLFLLLADLDISYPAVRKGTGNKPDGKLNLDRLLLLTWGTMMRGVPRYESAFAEKDGKLREVTVLVTKRNYGWTERWRLGIGL